MPTFFGVEYPAVPSNVADLYGSCKLIRAVQDPSDYISEVLEDAPKYIPLKLAIDAQIYSQALDEGGDLVVQNAIEALTGYQNYLINVSSVRYEAATDALAMYELAPQNAFWNALNFSNIFGDNENDYPPLGWCDLNKNFIQDQVFPRLNAMAADIGAAAHWAEGTQTAIQQYLDEQLEAAEVVNEIAILENETLNIIAENRKIYEDIRLGRFTSNLSQLSIIGAGLFLGYDLVTK